MSRLIESRREGIALLVVVLLTMVVAAIAAGAALIGANSFLISEYDQSQSLLESAADAGLEYARAHLNAEPSLFPDSGFVVIENDAPVVDAAGATIPGVRRTTWVGPVGGGPGEYGSFGAILSEARDEGNARVIRRQDVLQESFASYAYFTDFEPTEIAFGNNDQLYGPVHSNSDIKIRSSGATFHGPVTTAAAFQGAGYATFMGDTASGVQRILMPTAGQLSRLRDRAQPGGMVFTPAPGGTAGQSTMRLHFIARDINSDGVREGFIRVYTSSRPDWVTGNVWSSSSSNPDTAFARTRNCGRWVGGVFQSVADLPSAQSYTVLTDANRRCYLGGADEISNGFIPNDGLGQWQPFPLGTHAALTGQPDAGFLFPLEGRELNPGFRGVIYVDGKVVISGTVRGRVTVAATGNIIIGDDVTYDTDPGSGTCRDMLGLFSAGQVIVADNTLNAPRRPRPSGTGAYLTYDETADEHLHASIMALSQFTAENWGSGSSTAEPCGPTAFGRGCLYVTGGLIQQSRGAVGSGGGTGYVKRYTHDTCGFDEPPPYFPSTGHFWRSRYYEVDPTGFDPASFYQALN